jgi:2-polyprenyl-3-methyl-5-hydroxy-6-metoxy-1,4-benzoquinol methylase
MSEKKLNIVGVSQKPTGSSIPDARNGWSREAEAQFERMWLVDPEQFNPLRNCMEKERIERTWNLITEFIDPKDKLAADLACGGGVMTKKLKETGAHVHALDIASNALKILKDQVPNVDAVYHQCLPHTTLADDAYDLVVADEVIAYLPSQQLRLFMAELCRLVKPAGFLVCSTALDFTTQDPLLRFSGLAETEFKIHKWSCSYHRLYIRLRDFFSAPGHYAKAFKDPTYLQRSLQELKGFSQKWLRWNSQGILGALWTGVQFLTNPVAKLLNQNKTVMLALEKICRTFWGDSGISHAILIASRRPLQPLVLPKDEIPIERKGKREVWE